MLITWPELKDKKHKNLPDTNTDNLISNHNPLNYN